MKSKIIALVSFLCISSIVAGCSGGDEDTLTLYTARSEALNEAVIPEFEDETGIDVEVITAGTGELMQRVESEKNNPAADVLWAGDETLLAGDKELFEKYVSSEDEEMMPEFQNESGYFTPAFADPAVFIVNKEKLEDIEVEGFEDLLNPELKGEIAFGDPTSSSSAFQAMTAMLYAMGDGDPMSDKAWDFAEDFLDNIDGKIIDSSGQVHKGVADGENSVGLTWEDPVVQYENSGSPVEVVFPKEGTIFPGESVQIVKDAENEENAEKFVDFMLSDEIQEKVGQELTVRPLREGTELADYMTPREDIELVEDYDEEWVSEHQGELEDKFSELLSKYE